MRTQANPVHAATLQRFFKTGPGQYGEGDRFLGLRVPQVRKLILPARALGMDAILELLRSEWHEERLLALLLMVDRRKRAPADEQLSLHRVYLDHLAYVNNWDLVDTSAEHLVGPYVDPNEPMLLHRLAASESVWERRVAVLATFYWIRRGVFAPTLELADRLLEDDHDLIHKALGWMLREVGKRDVATLEAFLPSRYRRMPRTMLRYAIERFPEARRKAYLAGDV